MGYAASGLLTTFRVPSALAVMYVMQLPLTIVTTLLSSLISQMRCLFKSLIGVVIGTLSPFWKIILCYTSNYIIHKQKFNDSAPRKVGGGFLEKNSILTSKCKASGGFY